jgi:hypothetical protein
MPQKKNAKKVTAALAEGRGMIPTSKEKLDCCCTVGDKEDHA